MGRCGDAAARRSFRRARKILHNRPAVPVPSLPIPREGLAPVNGASVRQPTVERSGPERLLAWVLGILLLAWAGMFLAQGVVVGLGLALGLGETASLMRDPAVLGVAQLLGLLPALSIAQRVLPRPPRPRGAPTIGLPVLGVALLAGAALQFVLGALAASLGDLVPFFAIDPEAARSLADAVRIDGVARAIAVPFCVVLAAPLTEELLFRGAVLPALTDRYGLAVGIGGSAFLFGAFHLHPASVVYATLAGLVLAAVTHRAASIRPSFALHAGFNGIPILLTEDVVPIPGFNTGPDGEHLPALVLVSASMLAVGSLLWLARLTDPARTIRRRATTRPS